MNEFPEYQKYRWFLTSSDLLVVGGKSAEQNDSLLKKLKEQKEERIIMHTALPGSPFSVIFAPISKIKKSDLEETATFTACFSRAWRSDAKKTEVHQFLLSQLKKTKLMKSGTWGVSGEVKKYEPKLKLYLTIQNEKLRAVPFKTKNTFAVILPGKIPKEDAIEELKSSLPENISREEILSALPPGGLRQEADKFRVARTKDQIK